MTVSSETARNDYIGTGLVDEYDFTFRILDQADLRVVKRNTSGGETVLVLGTDYTVAGVGDADGGTITLTTVLEDDYALAIRRYPTLVQETDLRNQAATHNEDLEDAYDRIMHIAQRLNDELSRRLRLPETEAGTSANTTLPTATLRANKNLVFDASGNPAVSSGASSSIPDVSLVQVVDTIAALKALAAPSAAVTYLVRGYHAAEDMGGGFFRWNSVDATTANNGTIVQLDAGGTGRFNRIYAGALNVLWFGAKGDGVTDDAAAFVAAVGALSSGGLLDVPRASYVLASATLNALTDHALTIPASNVSIVGHGRPTLTVTGVAQCGIFYASGISNLLITGLDLIGNNVNTSGGVYGSAIVIDNIDASAAISHFIVRDNLFSNFKGDGWIKIERDASKDFDLTDFWIEGNAFSGGGSRDLTDSGVASAAIYVTANDIVSGSSELKRGWIRSNRIDATEFKQGIEIISNSATRINMEDITVEGNHVIGAGDDATAVYGYGISVYGFIRAVTVRGNTIRDCRHAGVYSVSTFDLVVANNIISGQIDSTNAALARGGVAITNGTSWRVENNTISDCLRGLDLYTDRDVFTTFDVAHPVRSSLVCGNVVTNCSDFGSSIRPRGERIDVLANDINTPLADFGLKCVASTQSQALELLVGNNNISGKAGIFLSVTTGPAFIKEARFAGNTVRGTTGNGMQVTATAANGVTIENNRIFGDFTTGVYGLRLSALSEAVVAGNTVYEYETAYRLGSVTGRLEGNSAYRVTTVIHNGGSDLGQDTPSWGNWNAGTIVQKLDAVSGGSIGWLITVSGTFGTLNGSATTGGITSGLKALVVNANTDLTVGARITIAGVTGTKVVTAISGTSITIDVAADATVAAAAVAFAAPTVKSYGVIA